MLDFAWLGPGDVRVVEINPFDGAELGTMKASTCMFTWDDPKDQLTMREGPFELRWRKEPKKTIDLKMDMQSEWRNVLFASPWDPSIPRPKPAKEGDGKGPDPGKGSKGKAAVETLSVAKGKGKSASKCKPKPGVMIAPNSQEAADELESVHSSVVEG